mgnify:CR=1 FL=1
MRINKYIASAGICSRRKADDLVANGNVRINGVVVKEAGAQVGEGDVVEVNGSVISAAHKNVYIAVNKPLGYITSMEDDRERATVADLVTDIPERLFPVGRLDYNTTGLLIMTNDGQLTYTLTHPKHEVYKTYVARVEGVISGSRLAKLRRGVADCGKGYFLCAESIHKRACYRLPLRARSCNPHSNYGRHRQGCRKRYSYKERRGA